MKKLPEGHLDRYDWSRASRGRFAKRMVAERQRARGRTIAKAFPYTEAESGNLFANV